MDLLESAGIAEAKILISAIDNSDNVIHLTKMVKEKYPKVKLMLRAKNRYDAYDLLNMGVEDVYRQAQKFIQYDEESLRRLANKPKTREEYIFKAKEEIKQQEKQLEEDLNRGIIEFDNHWDSEQMRAAHNLTNDK